MFEAIRHCAQMIMFSIFDLKNQLNIVNDVCELPEIIDVREIIFDTVKYNQVHAISLKKQKLVAKFEPNVPHYLEFDPVRL
jgi:hypothetical protein